MALRYRFAQDEAGQLLDVLLLNRDTRHLLGPYLCLGCGKRVIPSLGDRLTHHFRHRHDGSCSRETYLHQAAKIAFHKAFTAAVAEGHPYEVRRPRRVVCLRHEAQFGKICTFEPKIEAIDLTRWVRQATIEARVEGFTADILLESDDGSMRILVEIAVTHPCEPAKIASGLRIMEIPVANEDDIVRIGSGLALDGQAGRGYNLVERPPVERSTCGGCRSKVTLFVVFASGKSLFMDVSLDAACDLVARGDVVHHEVSSWIGQPSEDRPLEIIARHVRLARYQRKVPVKSCLLCRSGAHSRRPGDGPPIWCIRKQTHVGHNTAADCADYMVFASLEQLMEKRQQQKSDASGGRAASGRISRLIF